MEDRCSPARPLVDERAWIWEGGGKRRGPPAPSKLSRVVAQPVAVTTCSLPCAADFLGDELVALLVVLDLHFIARFQVVELTFLVVEANRGFGVHVEGPVLAVGVRQDELLLVG